MFLQEIYQSVLEQIAETSQKQFLQRQNDGLQTQIRPLLVSKNQSVSDLAAAYQYQRHLSHPDKKPIFTLGESRLQEAERKIAELKQVLPLNAAISWEMIGPLQSNKVLRAVQLFSAIHSLASRKTADFLEAALEARGSTIDVYLQYNTSGEAQKNGCRSYQELENMTEFLLEKRHLRLKGLMTMSRLTGEKPDELETRRCFARCREDGLRLWRRFACPEPLELSMGMSKDYLWALEEGSSILRLGSCFFSKETR